MNTINRIDQLLADQGVPVRQRKRELEKVSGASYEAVRQWYNDPTRVIGSDYLKKIAKHYGVSLDYLTGMNSQRPARQPADVVMVEKNQIGDFLAGQALGKSATDPRITSAAAAMGIQSAFAFIERSAGMAPRISPGDTIIIDPTQNSPSATTHIYLFNINENYVLGTITDTPRGLMLSFDNQAPGWEPIPVSPDWCAGRVIAFIPSWL